MPKVSSQSRILVWPKICFKGSSHIYTAVKWRRFSFVVEENALLLQWVKGSLSWEDRGHRLPSQHNYPIVCQHLANQVWGFTSDWSGPILCTLITATQAFPEHFCRVFILEILAASTIMVACQDHTAKRSLAALPTAWGRAGRGANTKREGLTSAQGRHHGSSCRMSTSPHFIAGLLQLYPCRTTVLFLFLILQLNC